MLTAFVMLGLPVLFTFLQLALVRSRCPRWLKWMPFLLTGCAALVCGGAVFGFVSLPHTYLLDEGSLLPFPDFVYAAIVCVPILFGIGLGVLFGISDFDQKK